MNPTILSMPRTRCGVCCSLAGVRESLPRPYRVFSRYIVLWAKLHGTVKTVPYKPTEGSQSFRLLAAWRCAQRLVCAAGTNSTLFIIYYLLSFIFYLQNTAARRGGFPTPLFSILGIDSPAQMCYTGFIACNEIISRES